MDLPVRIYSLRHGGPARLRPGDGDPAADPADGRMVPRRRRRVHGEGARRGWRTWCAAPRSWCCRRISQAVIMRMVHARDLAGSGPHPRGRPAGRSAGALSRPSCASRARASCANAAGRVTRAWPEPARAAAWFVRDGSAALLWNSYIAAVAVASHSYGVGANLPGATTRTFAAMLDVIFVALGIGGFAVCLGYVYLCERL